MKKIIFALAGLLFFYIGHSQTSMEEYLYITKGLQEDLEKGKDIKTGYSLQLLQSAASVSFGNQSKNVTIYYLLKARERRAFVLKCVGSEGSLRYMCIPAANTNESVWNRVFADFNSTGADWRLAFCWALSRLTSQKLL